MSTAVEETTDSRQIKQLTNGSTSSKKETVTNKSLLGGKGAGLCEMTRAGLPVPPGLIVTTEACNAFFDNDKEFP